MKEDVYKKGLLAGGIIHIKAEVDNLKFEAERALSRYEMKAEYLKEREAELAELEAETNKGGNDETIKMLGELLKSYPEYSSQWIQCTGWRDYSQLTFEVEHDEGEFKTHVLNGSDLLPTWEKHGEDLCKRSEDENPLYWDQEELDVFMQYHFFGSVVYG